ncbi:hypothetical protein D3C78_1495200 [compost metagenome]
MAITHSVSTALLGTTRSYTFMLNSGMASANRLISTAASKASRYRRQLSSTTVQNQWLLRGASPCSARRSTRNWGRTKQTSPAWSCCKLSCPTSTGLPDSGYWTRKRPSSSSSSNRQARLFFRIRIAGSKPGGRPSSLRRTMREVQCARAAARASSDGVSR